MDAFSNLEKNTTTVEATKKPAAATAPVTASAPAAATNAKSKDAAPIQNSATAAVSSPAAVITVDTQKPPPSVKPEAVVPNHQQKMQTPPPTIKDTAEQKKLFPADLSSFSAVKKEATTPAVAPAAAVEPVANNDSSKESTPEKEKENSVEGDEPQSGSKLKYEYKPGKSRILLHLKHC